MYLLFLSVHLILFRFRDNVQTSCSPSLPGATFIFSGIPDPPSEPKQCPWGAVQLDTPSDSTKVILSIVSISVGISIGMASKLSHFENLNVPILLLNLLHTYILNF